MSNLVISNHGSSYKELTIFFGQLGCKHGKIIVVRTVVLIVVEYLTGEPILELSISSFHTISKEFEVAFS